MIELNAGRFSDFFQMLWGYPPFAWQRDLALRVLEPTGNPWPEAIALPTASGKTACIDIAVYALAARSTENDTIWVADAPRRIFFVVDRRVIVDEAFERARRIALKLRKAENGILREVADRLRQLAGSDIPLMCFQLRGGMCRSDAWARSPLQPAVIASTVDQVGSRLLFRAYGRSPKAWPIQAGLTGNDSLILLDEAHCSQPFMETLNSIQKYRTWAASPLSNPFHISIMSATPPDIRDVFYDTSKEPRIKGHPLGDRQLAPKIALLKESKASGKNARKEISGELAKEAEDLVNGRPLAVVIFANYVATARETYFLLREKYCEKAVLLTGRMRPIDKDDTISERLQRFQLSSSQAKERHLTSPVFVVATQTLEVGADLDFDLLVTECASIDALRQRFGRLNRMGREIEARAVILMRPDLVESSVDDPVYGEALARTWQWLNEQKDENNKIDMGIVELGKRLPDAEKLAMLNAPTAHAPVIMPAHVDCWGQTMPEPLPTPDVSIFLHGPGRASADVQVCWRVDIDLSTAESVERSLDVLSLCPPSAAEVLAVPIWAMRQWMDEGEIPLDEISDVEGTTNGKPGNDSDNNRSMLVRRVICWRGREDAKVIFDSGELGPGDVIVIPAVEKGWEGLGDFPSTADSPPVLDWGDRAHTKARGKFLLRLHPAVIKQWPEIALKSHFLLLAEKANATFDEDPESFMDSLKGSLRLLSDDETAPDWIRSTAAGLLKEKFLKHIIIPHPLQTGVIIRGRERIDPQAREYAEEHVDWFSDEDDSCASGTTYVPLEAHLKGVATLVRRFAAGCGLPDELSSVLGKAGWLHDIGKADPRFQALLKGGNPWACGELLAKSEDIPQSRLSFIRACKAVDYPEGYRHELLSVRLAESAPVLLPENTGFRELVLHLIESHHGHCRPFAPVVFDNNPVEVMLNLDNQNLIACSDTYLERLDSGVSDRFWQLTRSYGWWGLAWLEAIFRLADHRQSEQEEKNRRKER